MQFLRRQIGRTALRYRRLSRQKRRHERLVESIAAPEVLDGIGLRFSKDAFPDEIEDHFTEVIAALDAPVGEDGRDHGPVLFQRKEPDALEQLLPVDVVRAFLSFLAKLDREIERIAKEEVGFAIVAGVLLHDEFEFFTKVEFLHRWMEPGRMLETRAGAPGGRAYSAFQQLVNTIHASQLRAEAKHTSWQRQLPARAILAAWGAGILAFSPASVRSAEPPTARDELAAAELLETALLARQAGMEDLRKMETIYADLVAKYPKDAAVRNGQAEFFWNEEKHERALETWLAAEKLDPKNAVVLDHLGGAYLSAGETKKAAGYYARATASEPANAAYHYNFANVAYLFRHELLDADHADAAAVLRMALQHFRDASRLEPLNTEYARAYAETFYTVPDPDWPTALQAWQHFYEITPGKDFALLNLARVHMKLGHKSDARESLSQIKGPEFDRLKTRLRERIEAE